MADRSRILFVDAYDSFTQNIAALLQQGLNVQVTLVKIDTDIEAEFGVPLEQFVQTFAAIVLGPGPGDPRDGRLATGIFQPVIQYAANHMIPLLGICLGFQTICIAYGFSLQRLSRPCHGHAKQIIPLHVAFEPGDEQGNIFDVLSDDGHEIVATCYNSLGFLSSNCVKDPLESRPGSSGTNASFGSAASTNSTSDTTNNSMTVPLNVLAIDDSGYIMAVAHRSLPLWGFQFHPESCKSNTACHRLLEEWFSAARTWNRRSRTRKQVIPASPRYVQQLPSRSTVQSRNQNFNHGEEVWWSRTMFLDKMLEMVGPSGNRVQYVKTGPYCREHVADLVQSLSSSLTTNMLESTRKGRFSIYALTNGMTSVRSSIESGTRGTFFHLRTSRTKFALERVQTQSLCAPNRDLSARHDSYNPSQSVTGSIKRDHLLGALEDFMISKQSTGGPAEVPFWGGLLGYMSYEFGLDGINVNCDADASSSERTTSDMSLQWVDRCLVHDNQTSMVYIQSLRRDDTSFLNEMVNYLNASQTQRAVQARTNDIVARKASLRRVLRSGKISLPDRKRYNAAYDSCQHHLHAGDSYELCLTTVATIDLPSLTEGLEYALYKNMYAHNPVPYSAFLDLPDITIASTSPEEFMSWSREGTINMLPMKGTVKRSSSMTLARATAILNTPKEFAENLMIADLIRHDLYTAVGHTSKVEVVKLCEVVEHETVYQLISHIRAHAPIDPSLPENAKQQQATRYGLRALTTSLAPGSMTGAPKKRSCEILRSLEKRNRGLYSGVIGYLDVGGGGAWNVCIRTAFRNKRPISKSTSTSTSRAEKNDPDVSVESHHRWTVGAGGAITVLSDRDGEWDEMMVKLGSVLKGFSSVATDG